jgi:hypothetical protein
LENYGIINKKEKSNVIDRSKIRRERDKTRKALKRNQSIKSLKCLYFDGRKDKTNYFDDGRRLLTVEEHVVLIAEPGEEYLGHVSPEAGTSKGIVKAILHYLQKETIDSSCVRVIGCDGTNNNTGRNKILLL